MKFIPFILVVILFVCLFIYVYRKGNRSNNREKTDLRNNPYDGLRKQAIEISSADLGLSLSNIKPIVYGVIMDIGMPQGVITLVAYSTGDASIYLSSGAGIIGGGKHIQVNDAARQFVAIGQDFLNIASKAENTATAANNEVKLYLLTNQGIYIISEEIKKIDDGSSVYKSFFASGSSLLNKIQSTDNL